MWEYIVDEYEELFLFSALVHISKFLAMSMVCWIFNNFFFRSLEVNFRTQGDSHVTLQLPNLLCLVILFGLQLDIWYEDDKIRN